MERRAERNDSIPQGAIVDAPASLALWLRDGRVQRGMSLDDVARVTKIQPRILERIEAGKLDGLPAEVFVRGFIRSVARCIGLDEREALQRYAACAGTSMLGLGSVEIAPAARALVEAMADLAPRSATAARATPRKMLAVEVVEPHEATHDGPIDVASLASVATTVELAGSLRDLRAPAASTDAMPTVASSDARRATTEPGDAGARGEAIAEAAAPACAVDLGALASVDAALVAAPEAALVDAPAEIAPAIEAAADAVIAAPAALAQAIAPALPPVSKKKKGRRAKGRNKRKALAVGTPPGASPVVAAHNGQHGQNGHNGHNGHLGSSDAPWTPRMPLGSAPWRKPACAAGSTIVPRLVIDDADPDSAEQVLEERAERQAPRRSLLPPILLDREDRSARQGGLTLAVIILLIAATLTLSYLMRRPSASGDGMTLRGPALHMGVWSASNRA